MKRWEEMTAKERDTLVAVKVMGYTDSHNPHQDNYWFCRGEYVRYKSEFNPSTDIANAWEVVEKFDIYAVRREDSKSYRCEIYNDFQVHVATSRTAPEAICIAALKAMGVDVE